MELNNNINFHLNTDNDLNNHWLAGFTDADGCFQIKFINRSLSPHAHSAWGNSSNKKWEVRLNFQIDQKKEALLILIKNYLGGNIYYRKNQDTYYYGSTSFGSAKKVINYFDKFHLLSSKQINYLKWRKAYLIIQDKNHLNINGIEKIIKLKGPLSPPAKFFGGGGAPPALRAGGKGIKKVK